MATICAILFAVLLILADIAWWLAVLPQTDQSWGFAAFAILLPLAGICFGAEQLTKRRSQKEL